ncbi:phosphatidylinositol-4-phosphate 5-kinase family protein [Stylonychia lemnae]|uniref:Phosphatidylinositol-4-phosphate 5-kinase family protein n=1 Tax=Stylonychia lemnae TaxID=5949 RepID=A0A077ZZM0_STYLE|nr:phosphatidylinositol-4-phosphate 5-kinase family protein [Stylonychia lemnae]|eukprot:CDW73973.1 phosphatidylinositol-4-phosphate 5-kinase family protein [Stylonychia lemnae]
MFCSCASKKPSEFKGQKFIAKPLKKQKQPVIQNQKEEIERKCDRKLGSTMHELFTLIERFETQANIVKDDKRMMDLQAFREILGILGNFKISERMFQAIDDDRDGLISLEDYLIYNDIVSHGEEREKDFITFKIFDIQGQGKVAYDDFKVFWSQFIELYGEALQTRLQYEEELVQFAFKEIAGDKQFFDFPAFEKAKSNNPQLLEWLEQPGYFMQENVKEALNNHKIDIKVLEDYHNEVMGAFDQIEQLLEDQFGLQRHYTSRDLSNKKPSFGGFLRSKTLANPQMRPSSKNAAAVMKNVSYFQNSKLGKFPDLNISPSPLKGDINDRPTEHFLNHNIPFQRSINLNDIILTINQQISAQGSPNFDSPQINPNLNFKQITRKNTKQSVVNQEHEIYQREDEKLPYEEDSHSESNFDQTDENMSLLSSERNDDDRKNMPIAYDVKSFDKKPSMSRIVEKKKPQTSQRETESARIVNLKAQKISKLPIFLNTPESLGNFETPSKHLQQIMRESLDAEKFLSINERQDESLKTDTHKNDAKLLQESMINKAQIVKEYIDKFRQNLDEIVQGQRNEIDSKRKSKVQNKSQKFSRNGQKSTALGETQNGEELANSDGQVIRIGHQKFDLILNIMIGIKKAISNLIEIPFMELGDKQFLTRQRLENQWISNVHSQNDQKIKDFVFFDYAPLVFQRIRRLSEISEEDYLYSLGPDSILNCFWNNNYQSLYELCSSGKSGSLFYYTEDQKYMIKTISRDEFKKLKEILKQYYNHIKQNPSTLITRFFGLHKVSWKVQAIIHKKYLVVMNNIFKSFDVGIRFDLKGSTQGRRTLKADDTLIAAESDIKRALKDLDFIDNIKHIRFTREPNDTKPRLEDILVKDAEFFAQTKILDYSLLLGRLKNPEIIREQILTGEIRSDGIYFTEDGNAYIAGIIDILTEYNSRKRIEYSYKRLKYGSSMSCLPPQLYAKRFQDFMRKIIQTIEQPLLDLDLPEQSNEKIVHEQSNQE